MQILIHWVWSEGWVLTFLTSSSGVANTALKAARWYFALALPAFLHARPHAGLGMGWGGGNNSGRQEGTMKVFPHGARLCHTLQWGTLLPCFWSHSSNTQGAYWNQSSEGKRASGLVHNFLFPHLKTHLTSRTLIFPSAWLNFKQTSRL